MKIICLICCFPVLLLAGCAQKTSVIVPKTVSLLQNQHKFSEKDKHIPSLMIFLGRVYVESKVITDESLFAPGAVSLENSGRTNLDWAMEDAEETAADYLQIQSENRELARQKWRMDSVRLVAQLVDIYQLIDKVKVECPEDQPALDRLENQLLLKRTAYEKICVSLRTQAEIKFRLKITGFSDSLESVAGFWEQHRELLPFPQPKDLSQTEMNKLFISKLLAEKRAAEVYKYIQKKFKYDVIEEKSEISVQHFKSGSNRRACRYSLIPVTIN